jgi:holliday junction DNA helicase RuvA
MIAELRGILVGKEAGALIIDVQGVGYRVATPSSDLVVADLGSKIRLYTHLAVREDALDLYGFLNQEDRLVFLKLIDISGIGPKTALGILSTAGAETIVKAVVNEDPAYLVKAGGLSKKSAEKIVLGLKDKADQLSYRPRDLDITGEADIVEAIIALGYSPSEAREAARAIPREITDLSERIRSALKQLGTK